MSKLTFSLICFVVAVLFSGCFTNTGPAKGSGTGPQKPDVVQSLPEGRWYGKGVFVSNPFSQQTACTIAVGISQNNVQMVLNLADGTQRTENYRLSYTSENVAQWLTGFGGFIGSCSCQDTRCSCSDATNHFTQSLDFNGSSLNLYESNTLNGQSYGFSGSLTYQQ